MPMHSMFQSLGKIFKPLELLWGLLSLKFTIRNKKAPLPNVTRTAELRYNFCLFQIYWDTTPGPGTQWQPRPLHEAEQPKKTHIKLTFTEVIIFTVVTSSAIGKEQAAVENKQQETLT